MINRFNKRPLSDGHDAAKITKKMFKNQYNANELMSLVKENGWHRKRFDDFEIFDAEYGKNYL